MTDCIGSAFNVSGVMQCPNCRNIENGEWRIFNEDSDMEALMDDLQAHHQIIPMVPYCHHLSKQFTFTCMYNFYPSCSIRKMWKNTGVHVMVITGLFHCLLEQYQVSHLSFHLISPPIYQPKLTFYM